MDKSMVKTESKFKEPTAEDILKKDVRNGGISSILFGLVWWIPLGMAHGDQILVVGGIILIAEGILCVAIQRPVMMILDGLTLMAIGGLNVLAGMGSGSQFWTIFGGFQIYLGIKRIVSYSPNAKTWLEAGHEYAKLGEFDKAFACYSKALNMDPNIAPDINQLMAFAHNLRGVFVFGEGDMDGAIAEYKQALQISDKLTIAHYNLGVALEKKMETDLALAEFKSYLQIEPKGQFNQDARKAIERIEGRERRVSSQVL